MFEVVETPPPQRQAGDATATATAPAAAAAGMRSKALASSGTPSAPPAATAKDAPPAMETLTVTKQDGCSSTHVNDDSDRSFSNRTRQSVATTISTFNDRINKKKAMAAGSAAVNDRYAGCSSTGRSAVLGGSGAIYGNPRSTLALETYERITRKVNDSKVPALKSDQLMAENGLSVIKPSTMTKQGGGLTRANDDGDRTRVSRTAAAAMISTFNDRIDKKVQQAMVPMPVGADDIYGGRPRTGRSTVLGDFGASDENPSATLALGTYQEHIRRKANDSKAPTLETGQMMAKDGLPATKTLTMRPSTGRSNVVGSLGASDEKPSATLETYEERITRKANDSKVPALKSDQLMAENGLSVIKPSTMTKQDGGSTRASDDGDCTRVSRTAAAAMISTFNDRIDKKVQQAMVPMPVGADDIYGRRPRTGRSTVLGDLGASDEMPRSTFEDLLTRKMNDSKVPTLETDHTMTNDAPQAKFQELIVTEPYPAVGNNANDDISMIATSEWSKQRASPNQGDHAVVGATYVEEQASNINRRFYLGLNRLSVRMRNTRARRARRARQAAAEEGNRGGSGLTAIAEEGGATRPQTERNSSHSTTSARRRSSIASVVRRRSSAVSSAMSNMAAYFAGETLIEAVLVEEDGGARDVEALVVADRVGFLEQKWKTLVCSMGFLVVSMGVVLSVVLSLKNPTRGEGQEGVKDRQYCSPCINRTAYTIKALLSTDDYIPSAIDSANAMGVNLDVGFYDQSLVENQMAEDIRLAAAPESGVDALIVTVPNEEVASAVRYAAGRGKPVFGVDVGLEFASGPEGLLKNGSMLSFTTMDDRYAGEMAASYFLEHFSFANDDRNDSTRLLNASSTIKPQHSHRALFVLHLNKGASRFKQERRYQGYRDRLLQESNDTVEVELIEAGHPPSRDDLEKKLFGCMYQSVLVSSGNLLPLIVNIADKIGCNDIKFGSFDNRAETINSMESGDLAFIIEQPNYLQGWASVQFAALYATTGLVVAPPRGSVHFSRPDFLTTLKDEISLCDKDANTADSLPSDPQTPQEQSKPIKELANSKEKPPNRESINLEPSESECIDKAKISIGGVVHGTTASKFWDAVFSAAHQSADDMGIQLIFDPFKPQESDEIFHEKMAAKILSLCESGVDGLFVTLSDDVVVDAVRNCTDLNPGVQFVSINTGYEKSKELNLIHHIGMMEEDAGYEAGKQMVQMATFDKALCWSNKSGLYHLNDRCKGFEHAMNEEGIDYLGQIVPQEGNTTDLVESRDWDGYGILLSDVSQLPAALEIRKFHPNFVVGSFDANSLLYEALETGEVLFGIDQQPYLQGYLAVSILTHAVTTQQYFLDHLIKSGPSFITLPRTEKRADCQHRNFPVCLVDGDSTFTPSAFPTRTVQPSSSISPSRSISTLPSSSVQPSSSPSFDPRPTFEIVRTRGHVRCGLGDAAINSGKGFYLDLCRAIASVIFGNPEAVVGVPVMADTRFQQLNGRSVDLLLSGDTHTIEREVRERTTGAGFAFSSPYYYDGMAYAGNQSFVECAEKQQHFGDCSSLVICVGQGTTGHDFVKTSFPPDFFTVGSSFDEITEMLWNDKCNVIANDRLILLDFVSKNKKSNRKYYVGNKLMTREPLAIVTRNEDPEFSNIINWVVHALFYGEEHGLTKNFLLCQNYTNLTSHASDLNFINAVYCVGNYGEMMFGAEQNNRGMNQINDGTTGMLYAVPFGELENEDGGLFASTHGQSSALLNNIRNEKGLLTCGITVPDKSAGEMTTIDKIAGMSIDYCRTLAAALFNGDSEAVNLVIFSENDNSSFVALYNGTIDVFANGRVELGYDFERIPSFGGFQFSTPYFYGNEIASDDVSMFSLVTREDDVMFSSFVNCVLLATIHAQENISKLTQGMKIAEIPFAPIFGNEFSWALRYATAYTGSYDKIYEEHFGVTPQEGRGRNYFNYQGGPQIHSFPGLSP